MFMAIGLGLYFFGELLIENSKNEGAFVIGVLAVMAGVLSCLVSIVKLCLMYLP